MASSHENWGLLIDVKNWFGAFFAPKCEKQDIIFLFITVKKKVEKKNEKKKTKNRALKFEKPLFCCFSKNFVQTWISLRFLTCAKVLTCFYEFVEKNLEVVWKKEGNTSSAKLP